MLGAYLHLDRLRVLREIQYKLRQLQSLTEISIVNDSKVLAIIYTNDSNYLEEKSKLISLQHEYPELLEVSYIETFPAFELQGGLA